MTVPSKKINFILYFCWPFTQTLSVIVTCARKPMQGYIFYLWFLTYLVGPINVMLFSHDVASLCIGKSCFNNSEHKKIF